MVSTINWLSLPGLGIPIAISGSARDLEERVFTPDGVFAQMPAGHPKGRR